MKAETLLLRTLRGDKTERKPVWIMRQAGRYLPAYQAIRKKMKSFKAMIRNPEIAAEITLQPVRILGVDAAILFSDILVLPEAMGCRFEIKEGKGPFFPHPIRTARDIHRLVIPEAEESFSYVTDAIRMIKRELNGRVPLIGFAGAPWTIFSYMTEGQGSKDFRKAKTFLFRETKLSKILLDKITRSTIMYLRAQADAGADVIQIFESWGGILDPESFREFAYPCIEKICRKLQGVPKIVFAKGCSYAMNDLAELPCEAIGIDWQADPRKCRKIPGRKKVLQGNLDPALLYADYRTIRNKTERMLKAFGPSHHIVNLGHGIYPDTKVENVKCFIRTVQES